MFSWFKKNRNADLSLHELKQNNKAIIRLPKNNDTFEYQLKQEEKDNNQIGYFKDGTLYDVYPRDKSISLDDNRQTAYGARYYVSDGIKYDMFDPKDIIEMHIPQFKGIEGMFPYVTRDLSYMVMMKAKQAHKRDLAVPLVYTAVNLMISSPIGWLYKDYDRMISQLERIGEEDYAIDLKQQIIDYDSSLLNYDHFKKKLADRQFEIAKEIGTDLVEIPYLGCACSECAIYQGRVYSISGKDTRFPKLPEFIKTTGRIHEGCKHSIFAFSEVSNSMNKYVYRTDGNVDSIQVDAIINSNRPFVDDRTEIEKIRYENVRIREEKMKR